MPKLWSETIESHRRVVHDAILGTTAALVAAHGLRAVTMSQIAEGSGIGRATLYKYFPDVEAILGAWHEAQVTNHLSRLVGLSDKANGAGERLAAVLHGYALILQEIAVQHHGGDLVALVHQGEHVAHAEQQLRQFVGELLVDAVRTGDVRSDVSSDELVSYCLNALSAGSSMSSKAAIRRLVTVVLDGLGPARR